MKVPAETTLVIFTPLGCGIQTGAGAIINTLDVQPEKSVAIFGVGSVGMSAVMVAKMRGASVVIAIDLKPHRLELAKKLGATHTVVGSDEDLVAQIQKISGSNGVDYSVDCAGIPQVVESALDCLGTCGRQQLWEHPHRENEREWMCLPIWSWDVRILDVAKATVPLRKFRDNLPYSKLPFLLVVV